MVFCDSSSGSPIGLDALRVLPARDENLSLDRPPLVLTLAAVAGRVMILEGAAAAVGEVVRGVVQDLAVEDERAASAQRDRDRLIQRGLVDQAVVALRMVVRLEAPAVTARED